MTRTQWAITVFWVVIGFMLCWQMYSCNAKIEKRAEEHPGPTQFFAYQSNASSAVQPKPVYHGAAVQQIAFIVEPNTPANGQFTCEVTIKNVGTAKATNIQMNVRPYRGIMNADEDVSRTDVKPIDDSNRLAQISEWLTFPDLAPGEKSTQTVSFVDQAGVKPGKNPDPEIQFEAEKKPQDIKPRTPLGP
jgi:hypothetical protein